MSRRLKVWLWFAIILGASTTTMNAFYGRWTSVVIAIGALVGLASMLFANKKWGFPLVCACYVLSFAVGVFEGISGGTGILATVGMSFIGSALTPFVTFLFLINEKKK